MSKRNQHVVPHEEGWAVRGAASQRASSVHRTQREAIDAGRQIARNQGSELIRPWARWPYQGARFPW